MSLQQSRRVLDIDLNVPANPDEGNSDHLPWSEATAGTRHGDLDLDLNMPTIQNPEAMEVTRHGLPLQMVPINAGSSYGEGSYSHNQQLINYESYLNLRQSDVGTEEQGAPPYDFLPRVEAMPVARQGFVLQMVPIDVDLSDDDIIVSSPRSFAEAKNNARRNRRGITIDVDAEDNAGESEEEAAPLSPPKYATIDCPICLEPLVDETSTKCGHIFCAACLKTALAARKRCPTCRKKLTKRSYFRVFLSHNK